MDKLQDIILYICNQIPLFDNGALKINKLIWFIESEYYRRYYKTMSDVNFAAIDNGPVINDYKSVFDRMEANKLLNINKNNYRWIFTPKQESTLSTLNSEEKLIAKEFVEKLGNLNENSLKDLSHKDAYLITVKENKGKMGKIIDMDLVLLENNPLEEKNHDLSEESEKLQKIIESNNIETDN